MERKMEQLDKKGAEELLRKDMIVSFIIFILMHLLLFGIIFLVVNKWLISVIIISVLILLVAFFVYVMETESNIVSDNTLLAIGFTAIPLFIVSIFLTLKIVPYRGDNIILQRKYKLRLLIRKTKFKKLKFWK